MGESLKEYIKNHPARGFRSQPHYFQEGDFVAYYIKEDVAYEERIGELVTIYRSMKSNEMVGCKIKGLKRIMKTLGDFGMLRVMIKDGKVSLGLLFMGAALANPGCQEEYGKYGKSFVDVPVDLAQLPKAA